MYLKVPYVKENGVTRFATVEEVQTALPKDMQGLTVDTALNYPCVEFPAGASYEDHQRVQKHLEDAGFEAY
jgi:hypothetical protein